MKDKYFIDTNVLIYYFNGIVEDSLVDDILRHSFNISVITKIEFLSWRKLLDDKVLLSKANEFISYANVLYMDDAIVERAIMNRRSFGMKTPDAIIGATAQINGLHLLTNNVKDFEKLDIKITNAKVAY